MCKGKQDAYRHPRLFKKEVRKKFPYPYFADLLITEIESMTLWLLQLY